MRTPRIIEGREEGRKETLFESFYFCLPEVADISLSSYLFNRGGRGVAITITDIENFLEIFFETFVLVRKGTDVRNIGRDVYRARMIKEKGV